jgi:hypothetical protein
LTPDIALGVRIETVTELCELGEVEFARLVTRNTRLRKDLLCYRSNVLACSDLSSIGGLGTARYCDTILAGILYDC